MYLLAFLGLFSVQAYSQRTITGVVTDAGDGTTIPGVAVQVKGTTIGIVTGIDGDYSLSVPNDATILIFKYVGKKTQEVEIGSQTKINVVMEAESQELGATVVTAVGIKKDEKKLGYSVTQVNSENLTQGRDKSLVNSLQGKVAGVNITSSSGAPGASTRVILRGFSSLGGSNQPLFVVDGVPIDNSSSADGDINGGVDYGNRSNDLNPDDVESVSVLKGASGTALYGSRASNGVIIITTKKGKSASNKAKGTDVIYSGSMTFETPLRLPEFQGRYGQGIYGNKDLRENTSWGPIFDGKYHEWGAIVDNAQKIKKYEDIPDNVRDFFEIGTTFNNSVSIADGTEKMSYYFSYSNVTADGIFPYDVDSYKRNTVALRGMVKLSNKLVSSGSLNYVNKRNKFVPTGQGTTVYNQILQTPRDIDLKDLEDYNSEFNNVNNYYSPYTNNPYFILKEFGNDNEENRIYGNMQFEYEFTKWFKATWRMGADISNRFTKDWKAVVATSENTSNGQYNDYANKGDEPGSVAITNETSTVYNSDFILAFNKKFFNDELEASLIIGHNVNATSLKQSYSSISKLSVPEFYVLSNSPDKPFVSEYTQQHRIVGLFTNLDLYYKGFLNLTLSFRNDWSSTLPYEEERTWYSPGKSFSYPAASLAFIFTDAFPVLQKYINSGKIRAGVGQTGNDANPYLVYSAFVREAYGDGFTALSFPLSVGGINGFRTSTRIGNGSLQPEITTEFELGTDLRFFNNRIGVDLTWYTKTVTDMIWNATLPSSTGYSSQTLNLGEMTNSGIELLLTFTPVKKEDFSWTFSINFSNNKNKLVKLKSGMTNIDFSPVGGANSPKFMAYEGEALYIFEGASVVRDTVKDAKGNPILDKSRVVVDSKGIPVETTEKYRYGSSQYNFIAGLANTFEFKGISFGFTFDWRQGGLMYSRTASMCYFSGIVPHTLYNDRQPFIIPNSVEDVGGIDPATGKHVPVYVENTHIITSSTVYDHAGKGYMNFEKAFVLDKSFVKLREISFGYKVPRKYLANLPVGQIEVGVVGRNLFIWTPEVNRFIDPEATTFGNDSGADYGEFGATPSTRSFGFSLKFSF